ncbi:BarA-associated response regulator UvrY (= GacA = SirA) [hydrothermal vent metagenome]|uniref:BarA-associated response regulator UvrY (= GacA = SirA) n=1 Tax=hydrothermal vent metagenome TaxID=652676 RepID=A0A3B0Y6J7_9ZZZZ
MEQSEIKVLLVDNQALVRSGLRSLLNDINGISVIGEADSGETAVALCRQLNPHVVLMDAQIQGIGGLETIRRIIRSEPSIGIVIVTLQVDDPLQSRFLGAGASGCLTKHCGVEEIVEAVRAVALGERYISADIARQMALSMLPGSAQSPFERLSQREAQVLMMVAEGQGVHDISAHLCLSSKTVSTYRYRLFEKLGVGNDVELTRLAIRYGVVSLPLESKLGGYPSL